LIDYRQATLLRICLTNSIGFSASTAVPIWVGSGCVSASLVSIGAAVGLSVVWVGRIMALGLFVSLGGGVLARGLGVRAGLLLPLLAGAGVLGGGAAFIGGALIFFIAMVFLVPYIYALLAELDEAGRWASIGPGFVLTGVALGPGIAGVVSHGVDFTTVGYAALACVAAAMALFLCAQRLRSRGGVASAAQACSPAVHTSGPGVNPDGAPTAQFRDPEGTLVGMYTPMTEAPKKRFGGR